MIQNKTISIALNKKIRKINIMQVKKGVAREHFDAKQP